MSYLNSLEYKDARDKLQGVYKDTFLRIEGYYVRIYTNQSYEVQITLSQILSDFLTAQYEGKPLERITGTDVRKYAARMLESELSTNKGVLYYVFSIAALIWVLLLYMFFDVLMAEEFKGYTFLEKMDQLHLTVFLVIISICLFVFSYIKSKIAAVLFYRPKLINVISFLYYMIFALLINFYMNHIRANGRGMSGIRIPAPAALFLFPLITIFFVISGVLAFRKTRAKKLKLEAAEELIPEQVICQSCGKEHDLDYPKCPFCGYKDR